MDDTLWQIFKKATAHFLDSKTNYLIVLVIFVSFAAAVIAAAIFDYNVWETLLIKLGIDTTAGAVKAIGVDGVPKIVAASKDPNSAAANPPPAVSEPKGVNAETETFRPSSTLGTNFDRSKTL